MVMPRYTRQFELKEWQKANWNLKLTTALLGVNVQFKINKRRVPFKVNWELTSHTFQPTQRWQGLKNRNYISQQWFPTQWLYHTTKTPEHGHRASFSQFEILPKKIVFFSGRIQWTWIFKDIDEHFFSWEFASHLLRKKGHDFFVQFYWLHHCCEKLKT